MNLSLSRVAVPASLLTLLLAVAVTLPAQWPKQIDPNAPKNPDGSVILNAPPPKTAEGKPDFSGLWYVERAAPTQPAGALGQDAFRRSPFWNIGVSFKDGLPFTPYAAELRRQRMADESKDNPDAHCLPLGLGQLLHHPDPSKIIQTATLIVMLWEANANMRQIFLDGRSAPKNDPEPWWYGYSVGHWEGDTLVVETTGFRDGGWLDVDGSPLTDQGKVTERYRRPDYGRMEVDFTVEDPKAYTKPWTIHVSKRLSPGEELMEFICSENEKDAQHFVGQKK
jgi:hypothetical protein